MLTQRVSVALPPDITIAHYKGDRIAAVSLTFDDALPSHIATAIPILDEYGIKGTFFMFTDNIKPTGASTWDAWKRAAESGHEVGSHTKSHPMLTRIQKPAQLRDEIEGSADLIAARIGVRPSSFAYPFSDVNSDIKRMVYEVYAIDRADCRVWGGPGFSVDAGVRHIERAVERKDWFVCMIHGVGEPTWEPIEPDVLRGLAEYLSKNSDKIWTDTYSHVGGYAHMRNVAKITLRDVMKNSFFFRLTLPDGAVGSADMCPLPLTVKIALDGRDSSRVSGNVGGDPVHLALSASGDYLLAEVFADGRWVQMLWE